MEGEQKSSVGKIIGWLVVIVIVVWAGYTLFGKESTPKETGPIKVGVIAPLTGDAAAYGEPAIAIYNLTLKEINDAGGVNGRPLELVIEDSKCTGGAGVSAVQKLVNVDKVQVIIGGLCSGETIPAVPVAETGKVLVISPGASSPALTGISKFFVRNYPGDSAQGKVLAGLAYNTMGAKTVYIIAEQTDYGQGITKVFQETFTSLGGTVTVESFPSTVTDLKPQVTKAKAANKDAFLMVTQTPASGQKIFKAMRDLNWKPKFLINDVPASDPDLATYKDVVEGAYTAEVGTDANNPVFKHALEAYKGATGKDMPFQSYGQAEWDVLFMVRDGMKVVGNNGEKLADWFRTIKNWQGAAGSVTIGADGDPLVGHRAEIVKNGKAEVLK